jgi:lipoprotein-anchoring transpeptidase ErfK/SrfK
VESGSLEENAFEQRRALSEEESNAMSPKKNFRPLLLAGSLLMATAPQASAQFWFPAPAPAPAAPDPHAQKNWVKPLPKPLPKPVRPQANRELDDGIVDLSARTSLLEPEGHGRRGVEPGYAALPPDADPNYSTPVDLDPSVNYKQTTQHIVRDPTSEQAGTLTINTKLRKLYYSLGDGTAVEYGIAVGKAGFAWKGEASVGRKSYWPGWTPPPEMIQRRPELPDHMDGSLSNPLGARALYLFQGNKDTLFRIHGTNEPSSIGHAASSGCIRMMNADVIDLYGRVSKGARVVVM